MIAAVLLFLAGGAPALQAQKESPPEGPPYRVGGDVTRPEKISGPPPVYAIEARKARVTGVVILQTVIDEQGNVTEARVIKGLPMGLDMAALEAVRTWKFKPATLDGKPVPVHYNLTVSFQIETVPPFGPRLQAFFRGNPDFAALFQEKRFQEAAELLDRRARERPEDAEIRLARSYLFLEQGQLDKAQEALADRASAPGSQSQGEKKPVAATGSEPPHEGGDVTRPEKISGDFPNATEAVRRVGVSGTVILEAKIDEQGNVQDVRVVRGLHEELDRMAVKALRTWKFKPATHDGKPFEVFYTLTMNFR